MNSSWWTFVSTVVGGLIAVSSNFVVQRFQINAEKSKQSIAEGLRNEEKQQAVQQRNLESDAACWRLVKNQLDELWWETEAVAPGIHGNTAVGFVQPVKFKWFEHWNAISKISGTFALHDESAQKTLEQLRVTAKLMAVNAGMAQFSRENVWHGGVQQTIKSSDSATQALEDFRRLYFQINITIRDSIGFERLYSAPLIDNSGLQEELVKEIDVTGQEKSPND